MSDPNDTPDDLDAAYLRASEREAGGPSAASRAAILAEASAAAERRRAATAANEPWFRRPVVGGLAASVALVGIAVLLWRQTGVDPAVSMQQATQAEPIARAPEPFPAEPPAPAPAPESESARTADDARAAAPRAKLEQDAGASNRSLSAPRAAASREERATAGAPDAETLLQREFPRLGESGTAPEGVWILQDAGGRTLRTGTLQPGQTFGAITRQLQSELPERHVDAFEVRTVSTSLGATVQLGVARAR